MRLVWKTTRALDHSRPLWSLGLGQRSKRLEMVASESHNACHLDSGGGRALGKDKNLKTEKAIRDVEVTPGMLTT